MIVSVTNAMELILLIPMSLAFIICYCIVMLHRHAFINIALLVVFLLSAAQKIQTRQHNSDENVMSPAPVQRGQSGTG
jgi:hypothetical protein